jgi:hypothetical protein
MKKARVKNSQKGPDKLTTYTEFDSLRPSDMITLEELRSFPGCEKIDDKEGNEIIKSLYQLSLISYDVIYK